ncbi:MAG: hypothetical protein KF762_06685 [Acidobacteria bacterium]|nr:hypothetical protein [Acidobacteriota bacterium]
MIPRFIVLSLFLCLAFIATANETLAQNRKNAAQQGQEVNVTASATPAFAEVLLRKVELEAELEGLLIEYTDEFPRVVNLKHEVGLLNAEIENLRKVPAEQSGKLTLALGKLLVKRAELSTDLWVLLKTYKEEHPDVKRAKRRVEIYSNAITAILK